MVVCGVVLVLFGLVWLSPGQAPQSLQAVGFVMIGAGFGLTAAGVLRMNRAKG